MEKDTALEFYKLFRGEVFENFKSHRDALQHYLTFVVAVMAATIAGIFQIGDIGRIGAAIVVGPISNVLACVLAIKMCDRFYWAALERIAIVAKLESILGLRNPLDPANDSQRNTGLFPADKYFLPERWLVAAQHPTSGEFVQQHKHSGVNSIARRTFQLLIAVNIVLGATIVLIASL